MRKNGFKYSVTMRIIQHILAAFVVFIVIYSVVGTSVVINSAGKDVSYDELILNAKNVYQYDMGGDPAKAKEISLFVKPEESKVYFVIDGTEGNYDF